MMPRRSILSIPGHMKKMHAKARELGSDVVMFDLEDSVPVDMKQRARAQVVESLISMDWRHKPVTIRSNALNTRFGYRDILELVENAGHLLDAVVIPKVDHPGDVHFVHRLVQGIEMEKGFENSIGIEATIESAQGLENVSAIAKASDRVISLIFGIADYSASVGVSLTSISGHGEEEDSSYPGHRWHYPMSRIVMAAKANNLMAVDAPYGNFQDSEALRRSAGIAKALGYDGKWVIHPDQIDMVNDIFSPTVEDIARAKKIIQANEEAGHGAVAVDGRMVDNATVRLAKQLLARDKHKK